MKKSLMHTYIHTEQIENQPAQGEIVDGVRDGFRKADAEDLRFEDRVERVAPPRSNPRLFFRVTCRVLIWLPSRGGDGGGAFDTTARRG